MNELEQKIQELAQKGIETKDPNTGALWKLIGTLVFFATVWWTRYQLAAKERELAAARTELELQKARVELEWTHAQVAKLENSVVTMLEITRKRIELSQAAIVAQEVALEATKAKLEKVANFEDLNKIAGV
jgi:hypothetical protein